VVGIACGGEHTAWLIDRPVLEAALEPSGRAFIVDPSEGGTVKDGSIDVKDSDLIFPPQGIPKFGRVFVDEHPSLANPAFYHSP